MAVLASLVVRLTADTGDFQREMGKTQSLVKRFAGGIGKGMKVAGVAALTGIGAIGVAAGVAGGALTKLAIEAAPLEGIEDAFEGIAEASGKSADEMLKALKKGSAGMISQRELMKKYNLAAQLVSDQFANELPNAMGYLSKVSAATGEDMGFMMDSLVRGVGRLSPMILDNLGIQVDLTKAYEDYAEQIGITTGEMTKEQQQAALMAQVMEKLAENTANMPEIAGSAAAGLAGLGARVQDLKDSIGKAFLPVLGRLLDMLNSLIDKYGPMLTRWAETAGKGIVGLIDEMAKAIEGGWPTIMAQLEEWGKRFWDWLTGPDGAVGKAGGSLTKVLDAMGDWIETSWPVIAGYLKRWAIRFWEWIETDVVPVAMVKLEAVSQALKQWSESSATQAKLAEIGETTGRGLVEGVRALVTVAETWTPIMIGLADAVSQAMVEAALPAMYAIGANLARGVARGLADALGIEIPEALIGVVAALGLAPFPGLSQAPLSGYQAGGIVPGPIGVSRLAVVHGGERVSPAGQGGGEAALLGQILAVLEQIAAGRGGGAHVLSLEDQAYSLLPG